MTILFEEEVASPFSFSYQDVARQVIEEAVSYENFPYDIEVDLTITDDASLQDLNRTFRGIDSSTDVLSFPLVSYETAGEYKFIKEHPEYFNLETDAVMLGDIVISVEHVIAQAKEYGHSEKREFAFLVAHSMLHLLGFDHVTVEESEVMEKKQLDILNDIHITREEN